MYSEQITQRLGIAASIPPQTLNSGATANATTGGVDMSKFHRAFFLVEIGAVTSTGSITATLETSASSNLSSPTALTGNGVMTGLTTANKQYSFEIRADQLAAGQRYVGLKLAETAGQNVVVSAVAFGDEANHKPGNASNDTSVVTQNVL